MSKKNRVVTTEQQVKRKKIIMGATWGTILSGALISGITIPVVKAYKALPKATPILKNNDVVFEITSGGKKYNITYGEINKNNTTVNEKSHLSQEMDKHLFEYLYEKEYEASLYYDAVYNANKISSNQKSFKLDSIQEVKDKVKQEIENLKKKFKDQFGFQKKWQEKFDEEIAKPEWGKAKTEQEAIDYKATERLKAQSQRRYTFETNRDFTYTEVKDGIIANSDVEYTYKGNKIKIASKGEVIKIPFAKENENYVLPPADSPELKINTKDEYKVPIFTTRSFITKWEKSKFEELKNPILRYLKKWSGKKQLITSEFTINAKPDLKDKSKPWSVSKDQVIKLLKFTLFNGSTDDKVKVIPGMKAIKDFKGVSRILEVDPSTPISSSVLLSARNDETALDEVSNSSTNAKKFGTEGFKDIETRMNQKDPSIYLPLISALMPNVQANTKGIFKPKEETNLFDTLYSKLIEIFNTDEVIVGATTNTEIKALYDKLKNNSNGEMNKSDYTTEKSKEYAKLNDLIKSTLDGANADKLNKKLGEIFRDAFIDTSDKKLYAVYKTNGNYVFVNSEGITIQNIYQLENEEKTKKVILRDLQINAKLNYTTDFKEPLLNLDTMFNSIIDTDFKIAELIEKQDFKDYIKSKKYKTLESVEKQFDDAAIKSVIDYQKMLTVIAKSKFIKEKIKKIEDYAKEQINNAVFHDFSFQSSDESYWLTEHSNKKNLEMLKYIFEQLTEFLK
ncbi:HinT-interacting membrane complex protein P80 [Metamycoplasma hyosynoviae]|uniref:Membrane protein P80 n=1 Tax=Metamycoplasma hyosynoviae TaxID=29559 RepID=A0A9Q9BQJ3_9BACT|nr:hypothetical protein [Metamycoplasma hyosynoviae]MDC8900698.1 hypothetical protein [Metamycoplasma hyosynoviae]MDC8912214.1 hypothetical protein [Metamycoplasma hyosynoviae]MDC8912994.1 hypothetical protein [Metamycoplasma hyosynoviae]MDC8915087.1 hypothetical protein [Metamycoplasma hyosynoviae]MDC8917554.1 hypothetical protein [Metamycoplasma hyosynoviae]